MARLRWLWVVSAAWGAACAGPEAGTDIPDPSGALTGESLIAEVDHFIVDSPDAEALMGFFRDSLHLPEQWPFRRFGDFSSGAVSLGNVVLEFVGSESPSRTAFGWVALEPVDTTEELVGQLELRGIAHGEPEPTFFPDAETGGQWGWINTSLSGLSGPGGTDFVFICDYRPRQRIEQDHAEAAAELAAQNGGPLGIRGVKEIVAGVLDVDAARKEWIKLSGSASQDAEAVIDFGPGPDIRLERADTAGVKRIELLVHSVERAREFLASRNLLETESHPEVAISRAVIRGLHVVLKDR